MIVATGFFDGVHLGHRQVIRQLVETAAARGDESMVLTFWPHPRTVLQDDARSLRLLSTLAEKKELLTELGVDHVEVLPFSREFSRWTAREYLEEVVIGRYGGRAILLGYDNRIGSDGLAPEEIARLAASLGLDVIRPECVAGPGPLRSGNAGRSLAPEGAISSTRIRKELEEGRVEEAAAMLGYPYRLHGVVVAGNRLGRTIGFPTANMQLYEPLKLVPANGVYQVKVLTKIYTVLTLPSPSCGRCGTNVVSIPWTICARSWRETVHFVFNNFLFIFAQQGSAHLGRTPF